MDQYLVSWKSEFHVQLLPIPCRQPSMFLLCSQGAGYTPFAWQWPAESLGSNWPVSRGFFPIPDFGRIWTSHARS